MVLGRSVLSNGCAMVFGRIAFVDAPVVLGKLLVDLRHEVVTIGLGEDRSRGYRHHLAVALDYRRVGNVLEGVEAVAVDEQGFGAHLELTYGAVHCLDAGTQDVDAVDLAVIDDSYSPGYCLTLDDGAELVALTFGEFL